jgi:hypothetical protein
MREESMPHDSAHALQLPLVVQDIIEYSNALGR